MLVLCVTIQYAQRVLRQGANWFPVRKAVVAGCALIAKGIIKHVVRGPVRLQPLAAREPSPQPGVVVPSAGARPGTAEENSCGFCHMQFPAPMAAQDCSQCGQSFCAVHIAFHQLDCSVVPMRRRQGSRSSGGRPAVIVYSQPDPAPPGCFSCWMCKNTPELAQRAFNCSGCDKNIVHNLLFGGDA